MKNKCFFIDYDKDIAFVVLVFQVVLKKVFSCRVPGCTNRADKNSNIIALATIIIMLL